jgi:hypothetical protein
VRTALSTEGRKNVAGDQAATTSAPGTEGVSLLESVELTQLYVRFRTELLPVRPLLCLIEARAHRRAYAELVQACHAHFLRKRYEAVSDVLAVKLRQAISRATRRQAEAVASSAVNAPRPSETASQAPSSTAARTAGGSSNASASAVLDAIRHSCAVASRTLQAEHALFHTLFVSPPTAPAPSESSSATMQTHRGAREGSSSVVTGGMPVALRSAAEASLCTSMDDLAAMVVDTLRPLILQASKSAAAFFRCRCAGLLILSDSFQPPPTHTHTHTHHPAPRFLHMPICSCSHAVVVPFITC